MQLNNLSPAKVAQKRKSASVAASVLAGGKPAVPGIKDKNPEAAARCVRDLKADKCLCRCVCLSTVSRPALVALLRNSQCRANKVDGETVNLDATEGGFDQCVDQARQVMYPARLSGN